jgi:hypothetical protein
VGKEAKVKQLAFVPLDGVSPAPLGGTLPVIKKTVLRDLIPDLTALGGYVLDKVESFAVDRDGQSR